MSYGGLRRDRTFVTALALSLLWHFFWFFSVVIEVSDKKKPKIRPKIVSLGSVLDDDIFRTLVESRPQISETFYRNLNDFTAPLEPAQKKIERREPGEAVSVPLGTRFLESVKVLVGGDKQSPEYEFVSRIQLGYGDESQDIEGEVRDRAFVSRPDEPQVLSGLGAALKGAEVEIRFTVDAAGAVKEADVAHSCGKPAIDQQWLRYVQRWRFAPLDPEQGVGDQTGTARFRLGPKPGDRA